MIDELRQQLDAEWTKPVKDFTKIEMLHAQYTKAWHDFEDKVWMECKLPRHELLLKRSNFG